MSQPVQILGIGANGLESLSPKAREALAAATFVAGGARHLAIVGVQEAEAFTIGNNLAELVQRLLERRPDERCVVLASGDPLCFGVGTTLSAHLPAADLVVEPAVSSLQLAFARAGVAWHDAALASIHGRPLAATLLPLLGLPKIGLLTHDGESPSHVARFFLDRGLDDYTAWIGEDLGAIGERVTRLDLAELPGRRFGDLNVMVLVRREVHHAIDRNDVVPPDEQFARPGLGPVLLTHADVRAAVLARFRDLPDGPIWDLGAGLGGVTIGLARRFRGAEIVAVERAPAQVEFLRRNRQRFEAWNVRVVEGEAPDVLSNEQAPAAVFLGGSGGRLDAILDLVLDRLLPGGRLVANVIGVEHLGSIWERLRQAGWAADVTQVQASHGRPLGELTTFVPERPVWIIQAVRPRGEPGSAPQAR